MKLFFEIITFFFAAVGACAFIGGVFRFLCRGRVRFEMSRVYVPGEDETSDDVMKKTADNETVRGKTVFIMGNGSERDRLISALSVRYGRIYVIRTYNETYEKHNEEANVGEEGFSDRRRSSRNDRIRK
ncbi:MAG TPA: hypothetical protein PLT66_00780 [Bacillota bacterium]|nr:hypothetical protein [Bacillota bacterium]